MRRTVSFGTLAFLAVAAVALAAASASNYSALSGQATYNRYCSSCHGPAGGGDGAIAGTLAVPPADLTRLAAKNDGKFPEERVWAVIDGREEVATHGPRDMPVWGDALLWPEEESPARREQVTRKIGELVAYVAMLQTPAAATN